MNYTGKSAHLSPCGKYRYALTREWGPGLPTCTFIGLNPSTADADNDDATIRRCVAYAASWDCGQLIMVNLFPYRATNPADLIGVKYPLQVSIINENSIKQALSQSQIAIAAWGNDGKLRGAGEYMLTKYRDKLSYLQINKATGMPGHPLYLKKSLRPIRFDNEL
jgi:hypothetical protein